MATDNHKAGVSDKAAQPSSSPHGIGADDTVTITVVKSKSTGEQEHLVTWTIDAKDMPLYVLDAAIRSQPPRRGDTPNAGLVEALERSGNLKPRFETKQQLFDALDEVAEG